MALFSTGRQWTDDYILYTPSASPAVETDFPVTEIVSLHPHPVDRHTRSTSTAQQDFIAAIGASVSLACVGLLGVNFTSFQWAYSTDGSTYTDFTGSPFAPVLVRGYYRYFLAQTVTATHVRVRVPINTPRTDGTGYYKLGKLWLSRTLNTLPYENPLPEDRIAVRRRYLRSGADRMRVSPLSARHEWIFELPEADAAMIEQLAVLGADTSFLAYENDGNPGAVAIMRAAEDEASWQRGLAHQTSSMVFEEQI